jgi:nucleotide-binding universal stress UspA family protein
MLKKRPVVVGFDGSAAARGAALWAADQATRHGLPLSLVCAISLEGCCHTGVNRPLSSLSEGLQAEARHELRLMAEEILETHPHLVVQSWVHHGRPAPALIEQSRQATLLVLGAASAEASRTALPPGSVAHSLAGYGHSPVALIPRRGSGPESGPVVVGLDGSATDEEVLAIAFEEVTVRRTELVAVHAGNDYTCELEYRYVARRGTDWEATRAQEQQVLDEWLAKWREKYPNVLVSTAVSAQPPALCLTSRARTAQLLVVGARGHGGFAELRLGSTSAALIRQCPCPLIVARP